MPFFPIIRGIAPFVIVLRIAAATLAASPSAEGPGSISDPNLVYVGRWEAQASGVRHGHWSGVYLRTKFTGSSVAISLASPTLLAVSIDGEPPREVGAAAGLTPLHAHSLKKQEHQLVHEHQLIVGSAGQNYEVAFQGLKFDPDAMTKLPATRPVIEYVGDSITVGNGSYAWRSAQMLDCDHVQIAFSGVALTNGFGCSTKVGMDVQYFCLKNFNHVKEKPVPWTFDYTPRAIVINLGQNDQCGSEPDETMTASYSNFIRSLRAKFPATPIVALRPFGGPYARAEKAAVDGLVAAGDKHLLFVDTTGWLNADDFLDGIHPNFDGNFKAGWRLADVLAPLLIESK